MISEIITEKGDVILLAGLYDPSSTGKGNPWHDPHSGRFTYGPPGVRVLRGALHLKNLPNEGKRLIDSRRARFGLHVDGITADRIGDNLRVSLFAGPRRVDTFDVSALEKGQTGKNVPGSDVGLIPTHPKRIVYERIIQELHGFGMALHQGEHADESPGARHLTKSEKERMFALRREFDDLVAEGVFRREPHSLLEKIEISRAMARRKHFNPPERVLLQQWRRDQISSELNKAKGDLHEIGITMDDQLRAMMPEEFDRIAILSRRIEDSRSEIDDLEALMAKERSLPTDMGRKRFIDGLEQEVIAHRRAIANHIEEKQRTRDRMNLMLRLTMKEGPYAEFDASKVAQIIRREGVPTRRMLQDIIDTVIRIDGRGTQWTDWPEHKLMFQDLGDWLAGQADWKGNVKLHNDQEGRMNNLLESLPRYINEREIPSIDFFETDTATHEASHLAMSAAERKILERDYQSDPGAFIEEAMVESIGRWRHWQTFREMGIEKIVDYPGSTYSYEVLTAMRGSYTHEVQWLRNNFLDPMQEKLKAGSVTKARISVYSRVQADLENTDIRHDLRGRMGIVSEIRRDPSGNNIGVELDTPHAGFGARQVTWFKKEQLIHFDEDGPTHDEAMTYAIGKLKDIHAGVGNHHHRLIAMNLVLNAHGLPTMQHHQYYDIPTFEVDEHHTSPKAHEVVQEVDRIVHSVASTKSAEFPGIVDTPKPERQRVKVQPKRLRVKRVPDSRVEPNALSTEIADAKAEIKVLEGRLRVETPGGMNDPEATISEFGYSSMQMRKAFLERRIIDAQAGYVTDGPAAQQLDELLAEWGKSLSLKEKQGLGAYRLEYGFRAINEYLRKGDLPQTGKLQDETLLKTQIEGIDSAMEKSPLTEVPIDTVLYRGVKDVREALGKKISKGKTVEEKGYVSTSTEWDVALDYTSYSKNGALIKILVPAGTKGAWMPGAGLEHGGDNKEFVLPRDSSFEIVSVERPHVGGFPMITLKLTPQRVPGSKIPRSPSGSYKGMREATQAERTQYRIPPAWTDVVINTDPGAKVIAIGKDSKGRPQYIYSAEHSERAAAAKFERLKAVFEKYDSIIEQARKDAKDNEAARALLLIALTGFRVGGKAPTKADVKAFGAATLHSSHLKVKGDTLSFDFIGKEGIRIQHVLKDKQLAELLKSREGDLFNTTSDTIRAYLGRIAGKDILPKDLRTLNANIVALRAISQITAPKNKAELRAAKQEVAMIVSDYLGNTPKIALDSYIDPSIFAEWEAGIA